MNVDAKYDGPANEESKQYSAAAQYYVPNRFGMPRLINEYVAVRHTIYAPASVGLYPVVSPGRFIIRSATGDSNQIERYEPVVNWNMLAGAGTGLLGALYTRYDEWRIRVMKVTWESVEGQRVGLLESPAIENGDVRNLNAKKWIWYCSDHKQYDDENPFPDYLTTKRAMRAGENLKPVGQECDKGFSVTFVPQAVAQDDTTGGVQYNDFPMPWVPADETHKAMAFRAPVLVVNPPFRNPARTEAEYQCMYSVVIEFRGLDYNKL